MSRSKDLVVRTNAAYNLPCMFYYFSNTKPALDNGHAGSTPNNKEKDGICDIDFFDLFKVFTKDEDSEIRVITGIGLHESMTLWHRAGKDPFEFKEALFTLLKDTSDVKNRISVITNLSSIVDTLNGHFLTEMLTPIETFFEE